MTTTSLSANQRAAEAQVHSRFKSSFLSAFWVFIVGVSCLIASPDAIAEGFVPSSSESLDESSKKLDLYPTSLSQDKYEETFQIIIRPIGSVPQALLQQSCGWIRAELGLACTSDDNTTPSSPSEFSLAQLSELSWDTVRQQLNAKILIDQLFYLRSRRLDRERHIVPIELWISAHDIYESQRPYVFGLTSLTDRIALVSIARLSINSDFGPSRLRKLILHELGHSFGLHHHSVLDCVMRIDATVDSLDQAPLHICSSCKNLIKFQLSQFKHSNQSIFHLALGHIARGDTDRAYLLSQNLNFSLEPQLVVKLAIIFSRMHAYDNAIAIFERSLEWSQAQDLSQAEIHLALARSFERRARDQLDFVNAKYHYERACSLRPAWKLAQEELQRYLNHYRREEVAMLQDWKQDQDSHPIPL